MGETFVAREYRESWWQRWPSMVFTIRRSLRRAVRVDQPTGCPLTLTIARRYWHVRWAGLGIGAWPMLELTLTNRSAEAVHSFALRFLARPGGYPGGAGIHPEALLPGATLSHTHQEDGAGCLAVSVDFVQYASGEVWYSPADGCLVTEAGVEAGAHAAAVYSQGLLARSDADTLIAQLPRLRADVRSPMDNPEFGPFGFYSGVTSIAVRVKAAFERDGQAGVETLLQKEASRT